MNDKERKDLIKKLHDRLIEIDKEINKESNTKENLIKKKEEAIKINDKMNEMLNYIKKERNELDNKQKNVKTSNLEKSKKEGIIENVKETAKITGATILLIMVSLGFTGMTAIYVAITGKTTKVPLSRKTIRK